MKQTGYVWHERYAWHDTGTHTGYHPAGGFLQPHHNLESAESKGRFAGLVEVSGLIDKLVKIPARYATQQDLLRVHSAEHVVRVKSLSDSKGGDGGDGVTPFGPGSFEIGLLAAGGTIAATEAVLNGHVKNAYALVRPPGHHALRDSGMGYCLFSNIAVAIEWARAHKGIERVAVVDYDVHHGNGTQAIYYSDPNVLTISIHQDQLYPTDSGMIEEIGEGEGKGYAINIPLPSGSGNGAYGEVIRKVVKPALRMFQPDFIIVASGFDASTFDPLGRMCVTSTGYRDMAQQLVEIADEVCGGRLVMSHEGGYSPFYVPFCGLAVLEAMSGHRTDVIDPFLASHDGLPAHDLVPSQQDVIDRATTLAKQLRLVV